jgi:outer membrane lipoprotein-sorting protein
MLGVALVVAAAAVVGGLALAQQSGPSGEALLNDTRDRYAAAETLVVNATVAVANDTEARTYQVSLAATDENRSKLTVTGENGTVVAGTNGSVAWVHSERLGVTRVVSRDDLRSKHDAWNESHQWHDGEHWNESHAAKLDAARSLLADWTPENTTTELAGTELIDGTATQVVTVTPDNESRSGTLTYWIDANESTVVQQRFEGEHGTVTARYTLTEFNASIAPSTFEPPSRMALDRATAVTSFGTLQQATSFDLPKFDGDGFEFESGSTIRYGNSTTVVQQYDGPAAVAVVTTNADRNVTERGNATTVEVAGREALLAETERGTVVSWTDGDVRHAIVAEQPRETVLGYAEAMLNDTGAAA